MSITIMNDEENSEEMVRFPDTTKYSAVGVIIGMVAVFFMVVLSLIFPPEASGMDQAKPVNVFISNAFAYTGEITLIILLDTIFIVGYVSLFIGLWLLIRDFSEIMSKLGLITGLLVGLFDVIENTIVLVLVNGLQTGWMPDEKLYGIIFLLNTFIDLLSYVAAIIYAIIFLIIFRPWDGKFVLGVLLVIYTIIGLTSIIIPAFFRIRSLIFVIGLAVGGIVLWREEDIPSELLENLLEQQKQGKNDFIR